MLSIFRTFISPHALPRPLLANSRKFSSHASSIALSSLYKSRKTIISLKPCATLYDSSFFTTQKRHLTTIEPTSSDAIRETVLKIGDLKAMGLIHNTPVGAVEALLEAIHVYTGLPWWGTIIFTTLVMRIIFLPLIINSQRNTIKLISLQPKIEKMMEDFKKAKNSGDNILLMRKHQQIREFYAENKISPLKNFYLIALQTPVMISFFIAVKKMAEFPVPGFENGGVLWFQNLTLPDPYYILPFLMSATFIAMMETSDASRINTPSANTMKWVFRGVTVISIPVAMSLSSSVHMYLMSSTIFSVLQTVLMNNKSIRRYLNLPNMPQMVKKSNQKSFLEQLKQLNTDVLMCYKDNIVDMIN
ncbi:60Kd inner membrane protein-domain-containing protein [Gigaspora margarita]|uniref:60Kd inner membrane protein-domain-containing protein n=1 Tax=Gigaspora margarita TaxID=4874 RepID=A0A8H3X648_GIGMA|nr:60Kd inner membrane protein-domain-containing protein [Gigaspora margarita]